jgi:hypothetical protein
LEIHTQRLQNRRVISVQRKNLTESDKISGDWSDFWKHFASSSLKTTGRSLEAWEMKLIERKVLQTMTKMWNIWM